MDIGSALDDRSLVLEEGGVVGGQVVIGSLLDFVLSLGGLGVEGLHQEVYVSVNQDLGAVVVLLAISLVVYYCSLLEDSGSSIEGLELG